MNLDTITQSIATGLHHRLPGDDESLCGIKLIPDGFISKEASDLVMREFDICEECDGIFHYLEHGLSFDEASARFWSEGDVRPFNPPTSCGICFDSQEES